MHVRTNMKHIVVRGADDGVEKLPFPGASDMNARLRKLITAYQKSYKKEMIKLEQSEKVETDLEPCCFSAI